MQTSERSRQPISRHGNPKHVDDLEISAAEEGCIISRRGDDRIYFVNPTAALILELCTGENSVDEIADLVKQAYALPRAPIEDTAKVLKQLEADGLLLENDAEFA